MSLIALGWFMKHHDSRYYARDLYERYSVLSRNGRRLFRRRIAGVRSGARAPTPSQRQATVKQQQVDRQAAEVTARRERAAAAAEARMKALTLASQQQQLHC